MIILQEEVANLYARICQTNQQTPSRIMTLEHIQQQQKQGCDDNVAAVRNILAKLRTAKGHFDPHEEHINPAGVQNNVETVKDQVKYLKDALERLMETVKKHSKRPDSETAESGPVSAENEETMEQMVKLKSLLSTKREQIATLRTVLKANKQTAEVALHSLKTKYDSEKTVVSELDRSRSCPDCQFPMYPRLSPAMIVSVERGDEILLARSPHFPEGIMSVLAGFVEPGESAEDAVRAAAAKIGAKVAPPSTTVDVDVETK